MHAVLNPHKRIGKYPIATRLTASKLSSSSTRPRFFCQPFGSESESTSNSNLARSKKHAHSDFASGNDKYTAAIFDVRRQQCVLPRSPAKRLAIVTCMDARIDVLAQLGLQEGDANVIRNAGGSARDSLRSLVISQRLLHTREIAVFHHTDCGMLTFTTPGLRKALKEAAPADTAVARAADALDFLEFSDLDRSVQSDVEYLQQHPLILKDTVVTGWVYHVESGKVRRVV